MKTQNFWHVLDHFTVIFTRVSVVVIIVAVTKIFLQSLANPFYDDAKIGASTQEWWIIDPSDNNAIRKIDKPALVQAYDGEALPIGRTLCLSRPIYAHIYKELDGDDSKGNFNAKTWPLSDPGGGDRILTQGCQARISPSVLPKPGPGAPTPGLYTLNVWFVIPRNFLSFPLIVHLHPVKVWIGDEPAK